MIRSSPERGVIAAGLASIVLTLAACAPDDGVRGNARGTAIATARTTLPSPQIALPTDAAGKPVVMVWMGEHYYSPAELTIPVGTTVMWRMLGSQEHDVWAFDGSFHSPTMGPGDTYTFTFTRPGTYRYFCIPHSGDGMMGIIAVK